MIIHSNDTSADFLWCPVIFEPRCTVSWFGLKTPQLDDSCTVDNIITNQNTVENMDPSSPRVRLREFQNLSTIIGLPWTYDVQSTEDCVIFTFNKLFLKATLHRFVAR